MKTLITLLPSIALLLFTTIVQAQDCTNCRYTAPLFDSVTVEKGILFAEGPNSDGQTQQLRMDIYQPFGDTVKNRPMMIFAFGGGFVQGSRNDWYVIEVCKYFAQAGYVTAAIDYRYGINPLEILLGQYMRIFFRPMQDMRAAVQHFKADYSELGNNYNIDTSKIILGGGSAGAISALLSAYCDKPAEIGELGNLSALDVLGGFNTTSGFYDYYSWKVAAVVNVAGAIINTDWIEPGDVPVISAHGNQDQVVPYKIGLPALLQFLGFNLQGSYLVDSVAKAKGVCSYLYTMEGQDHPSESLDIEYIRSIVNRIMQRMYAVINNRSFCCQLNVENYPGDTLFYSTNDAVTLTANITNDTGAVQTMWCGLPCIFDDDNSQITIRPDSNLHYISTLVYDQHCQAADFTIVKEGVPTAVAEFQPSVFECRIVPNPAGETFRLQPVGGTAFTEDLTVELFDIAGQRILTRESNFYDITDYSFNVSDLAPGSYLIRLASKNGFWKPQKLIVY